MWKCYKFLTPALPFIWLPPLYQVLHRYALNGFDACNPGSSLSSKISGNFLAILLDRFHCNRFLCVWSSEKNVVYWQGPSLSLRQLRKRLTTAFAELNKTLCKQSHSVHAVKSTTVYLGRQPSGKEPVVFGSYSTLNIMLEHSVYLI